jgi:hypothetical protein
MKLALVLSSDAEDRALTDLQIAYHRAAGVDEVVDAGTAPTDADWVIDAGAGEFWWPRAESLKDVLEPIPPRYTVVQALVRQFVSPELDLRYAVEDLRAAGRTLLRPARRLDRHAAEVPLRAWYPLELFRLHDDEPLAGAGHLRDTRLRDALSSLRERGELAFRPPDIVEDAAYAVECAAVGEVDLPRLEAYISELEGRVAFLEQRLWPRVMRALAAATRRVRA